MFGSLIELFATLILGGVGGYFGYSYRLQTRLRVLEMRVTAYRELFALTEPASPTRLGRGQSLSEDEAADLGRKIYDWYYRDGNGLLMPNQTRAQLQWLQRSLQGEPTEDTDTDPVLGEVSRLRSMLRQDVGVFSQREQSWYGRRGGGR